MSCRRAFELDLAEFVADPRAEAFAPFLEHYPTCSECSAEVRVWSELEGQLRGEAASAHPTEEVLLRYEQSPAALGAAERQRVAAHVAECRSCADELATLRSFDFDALAPAPAPARGATRGSILAGLAERLRGLVLHPAFAYAVVLALLYPTARWVLQDLGTLPAPAVSREVGSLEAERKHDPRRQ
jgi:anti-sigma factor RsiW